MADSIRLYVGSLPYQARLSDVEDLFSQHKIAVQNIDIFIDPFTGRNPGYCFIDFWTPNDAREALMCLPGSLVRGRPIKINLNTRKHRNVNPSRLSQGRPTIIYDRGHQVDIVRTRPVDDQDYAFDRWDKVKSNSNPQAHWTAPTEEKRRLYVGGLPRIPYQRAVNADMMDLFQDYNVQAVSKIISPHPSMHNEPGSHYYCFVDLATAEQAEQAKRLLDGALTLYGGLFKISLSRKSHRPTKVEREQLGIVDETVREDRPARNLAGNWRRAD
ncbi:hypothetical protein CLAFUW4_10256 [Fulvia fulva]|uniref:RRM domain-containing protein n=1 Tax=Passalora fulva TaxID=5499 RepID=A0A9Q8LF70_PASFU|nr:uncharacterized protein CLAFUR5_04871 [Fulvia fulva]KAK4615935.1 hypothetical protein CLAFUR4_10260 [Fulvia fulva]KAK4616498.1 hypothetical protein CLAFUR0_10258 [Fulvia fulva]UJO16293.1 hypothetical protein CLAFUR5_04871 [Fulvia fulva]WPV19408.1 hypothetical protein CLAFUW4_10256 [Fulvia fulva]WPV34692.1 hypothetical protein CLAFUW7_10256 [Fulvia fulva]